MPSLEHNLAYLALAQLFCFALIRIVIPAFNLMASIFFCFFILFYSCLTSIYNHMAMTDLPPLSTYFTILPGQTDPFYHYHFRVASLPALHYRDLAFGFVCPPTIWHLLEAPNLQAPAFLGREIQGIPSFAKCHATFSIVFFNYHYSCSHPNFYGAKSGSLSQRKKG